MKKLVLIFALVASTVAFAGTPVKKINNSASVSGVVVDQFTNESLTGALITIDGIDIQIYTDMDGKFEINTLKAGVYTIKVSYISYKQEEVENAELTVGENNTYIIKMVAED